MLVSGAGLLLAFAFVLIGADRLFQYYGLGAFGGMAIGFVGMRITETGLYQQTDCCRTEITFGSIPVGFFIMIVGAVVLVLSFHKYTHS